MTPASLTDTLAVARMRSERVYNGTDPFPMRGDGYIALTMLDSALVVVAQIRSEAQAIADRFAKSGRHSNSVCSRCDECQAYAHARRILALTGDTETDKRDSYPDGTVWCPACERYHLDATGDTETRTP